MCQSTNNSNDDLNENNDPEYWVNMIDGLNTPFDHIERILLQNFNDNDSKIDIDKYFKDMYKFDFTNQNYGISRVKLGDYGQNDVRENVSNLGYATSRIPVYSPGYIVDSFTYTPFIDYATYNESDGIFSDEFLNKYNDESYNTPDEFSDTNRHALSRNLFKLGNLDKDIYDAKMSFRDSIETRDQKTYIHTFCEHLFTLFAKLSNVRMSHVIYGFKSPHTYWEGILALDIWYQMLWKNIDEKYPFDDKLLNKNPMTFDENGNIEDFDGKVMWDSGLYNDIQRHAESINNDRKDYTTPRGVLKEIYHIVDDGIDKDTLVEDEFKWFYQPGKVYSDSTKSKFTKYVNLHLGRAYEVMTPKEYCELINEPSLNGTYTKPAADVVDKTLFSDMVEGGRKALLDAFAVIRERHVFNIFNSKTNSIENFDESNIEYYSQSQCAIVIERVFSWIYRYLQFKSTTGEAFQKHINIDNGYKYFKTESLLESDNKDSSVYYDDRKSDDEDEDEYGYKPKYLSYLKKLIDDYLKPEQSVLDSDEKEVLNNAVSVLKKSAPNWVTDDWDLCPAHQQPKTSKNLMKRMALSAPLKRDADEEDPIKSVRVFYQLQSFMNASLSNSSVEISYDVNNKLAYVTYSNKSSEFELNLSSIAVTPIFTDDPGISWKLLGYSTEPNSTEVKYVPNRKLVASDIPESGVLNLYAVWDVKYVIRFNQGLADGTERMYDIQVTPDKNTILPKCEYTFGREVSVPEFTYYNVDGEWDDTSDYPIGQRKNLYVFDHWEYQKNGQTVKVNDKGIINIPSSGGQGYPLLTLTAIWKKQYDIITFKVDDKKYCDVRIDKDVNLLVYPNREPKFSANPKKRFLGWDMPEGSYLLGIRDDSPIVCFDGELPNNDIICEDTDGDANNDPIVCIDESIDTYGTFVNAYVTEVETLGLKLTFRYIDDKGQVVSKDILVDENQRIPRFHIHDEVTKDNKQLKFRYWKLESGNITSELTILSNSVLVAVYDEVIGYSSETEQDTISDIQTIYPEMYQSEVKDIECQYMLDNGRCGLVSGNPKLDDLNRISDLRCPFIRYMLNRKYVEEETDNDFSETTLIQIGDIEILLNALFKINIDIAHKEYFLKVELPNDTNWWYGYNMRTNVPIQCDTVQLDLSQKNEIICDEVICEQNGQSEDIVCDTLVCGNRTKDTEIICGPQQDPEIVCKHYDIVCDDIVCGDDDPNAQVVCRYEIPGVVCEVTDNIVCDTGNRYISFEPTVEYKFSNFHSSNQPIDGKLVCGVNLNTTRNWTITPVNRDLLNDIDGNHFNDVFYCFDFCKTTQSVLTTNGKSELDELTQKFDDIQKYYEIKPLCLYENSILQSPVDVNGFVKHRLSEIQRSSTQIRTMTAIVKKYRPIIVPNVRDIFNDCVNNSTRYQAELDNEYGVFGWCTIPSKTMVNMEYNEQAIMVPSSYDHYNRIGGSQFLQLDKDFYDIYRVWKDEDDKLISVIENSWYYLYSERDWTYFMKPFFDIGRNNDIYTMMMDSITDANSRPKTSNHLNGVIFEQTNEGRIKDPTFGDIVKTCKFLAKYHHNENNLKILSSRYTNMFTYDQLKKLTIDDSDKFNSKYGSKYVGDTTNLRFDDQDWIDDYDKTSSYVDAIENYTNELKYEYNIGQRHAIDDYDDDSVWLYITMTDPIEPLENIEVEDIMPFVFWWSNRGESGISAPVMPEVIPEPEDDDQTQ